MVWREKEKRKKCVFLWLSFRRNMDIQKTPHVLCEQLDTFVDHMGDVI